MGMLSGLLRSLLAKSRRGIIFAGHGVATHWKDRSTEEVHIGIADFVDSIDTLEALGFDFLGMEDVRAIANNGFYHQKSWAHLTFDDGYRNNLDVIYPILKARKIPFSIFVSTHHVQTGDLFPTFWLRAAEYLNLPLAQLFDDVTPGAGISTRIFQQKLRYASFSDHRKIVEDVKRLFSPEDMSVLAEFENDLPLSLEMLQTLANDPLVHIGSHSHQHVVFHRGQNEGVARSQMEQSWQLISSVWALEATPTFCFPNGDWTPQWAQMASDVGYDMAFTCNSGFVDKSTQAQIMPRFWLSNRRRLLLICGMSILGDKWLRLFGRKALPKLNVAV